MNSEKILIEINVAGVNRSFDCIVPRTLPAKLLCLGFLELVEQSMGIPFGAYRQALLMSERTGRILRLLPFQTPQDCFAYLRESGYAREALQPSTRQADGSIQNETEKTLWTQWEEGT